MTLEELQAKYISLQESNNVLTLDYDNLKNFSDANITVIDTKEKEILKLKESNMDLFLRVSNSKDEKIEKTSENILDLSDIINKIREVKND